jgi:hypothetical protein
MGSPASHSAAVVKQLVTSLLPKAVFDSSNLVIYTTAKLLLTHLRTAMPSPWMGRSAPRAASTHNAVKEQYLTHNSSTARTAHRYAVVSSPAHRHGGCAGLCHTLSQCSGINDYNTTKIHP